MTWEWLVFCCVCIVAGASLSAFVMWLVHDSEPVEVDVDA